MLDLNLIRENPELVRTSLKNRQMDASPVDEILRLDEQRRALLTQVESLKADRNAVSKEIGRSKDAAEREKKISAMREVGDRISALDKEVAEVEAELQAATSAIPNIPDDRTPIGASEDENVVLRTVGQLPEFDFEPKPHWELGPALGKQPFVRREPLAELAEQFAAGDDLAGAFLRGVNLQRLGVERLHAADIAPLPPLVADLCQQLVAGHRDEQGQKLLRMIGSKPASRDASEEARQHRLRDVHRVEQ